MAGEIYPRRKLGDGEQGLCSDDESSSASRSSSSSSSHIGPVEGDNGAEDPTANPSLTRTSLFMVSQPVVLGTAGKNSHKKPAVTNANKEPAKSISGQCQKEKRKQRSSNKPKAREQGAIKESRFADDLTL